MLVALLNNPLLNNLLVLLSLRRSGLGHASAVVLPTIAPVMRQEIDTLDNPETILDTDCRHLIDVGHYKNGGKYRSIVKIRARFLVDGVQKWFVATGFLVDKQIVVTAGHAVFRVGDGWCNEVEVWVGYGLANKGTHPQCRYAHSVITTEQWRGQQNPRFDVAFIRVHEPFTGHLNVLRCGSMPSGTGVLHIIGYPRDRDGGVQMYGEDALTTWNVNTDRRHMIKYQISTNSGQSGSPIITETEEGMKVIGIHTYGAADGGASNSGVSFGGQWGINLGQYLPSFDRPNSFTTQPYHRRLILPGSWSLHTEPVDIPSRGPSNHDTQVEAGSAGGLSMTAAKTSLTERDTMTQALSRVILMSLDLAIQELGLGPHVHVVIGYITSIVNALVSLFK
ncbi:hypothetical protein ONZ45_g849 [Pleurotus djamor]|nr:hypothetical protein ONZ45_g849 [Pleurotus djamor]